MKKCLRQSWAWLGDENNRGRVIVIATVAGLIIALVSIFITKGTGLTPPPPGGEVRLSVKDFQAVLEKREQEIKKELARAHGDERSRLENELTEVKRQLSDIEAAHAEALRQLREMETALIRLGDDISENRLAEIRTAIEVGDFPKADALLAEADPLANARRATIYVGRAVNVKGTTVNGFYPTEDIEFHEQAAGFLYTYPVRNAHKRMKVIEKTETTTRGLLWSGLWIVTCKHCVEGKQLIGVRINAVNGTTRTYLSTENEWTTHPTMDVAVAMLPLGRDTHITFEYLERSRAAGRQELKLNQLHEGIPIVVIGYPTGMITRGRMNYPVIHQGHIGQIQGYLANDPHHPSFLVAGSAFPGNSGGPVLVPAGIRKPMGMELGQTVLIGMMCAQRLAPVTEHGSVQSRVLQQSADLAEVVPVDVIDETIESSAQWQRMGY